jgi:hypothetical protein
VKRLQVKADSPSKEQGAIDLDDIQPLYHQVKDLVPINALAKKNLTKSWRYGYNTQYDMIVISKDGTIGDIYEINGLRVALPSYKKEAISRSDNKIDQYWKRSELPDALKKIKNIEAWNTRPMAFRENWAPYIDTEFNRRADGVFFMNKGLPVYVTGKHYFYLQWSRIDGQYPDYREANRIFWIYWEACIADDRCYGMVYLKIRRSGFSYMAASDTIEEATLASNAELGILSKTGPDAKKLFTGKIVPMNTNLPFFFKPIQDGMDKPKTELVYQVPAKKISRKNMFLEEEDEEGLNTTINWLATDSNSYDGYKLRRLIQDESGKWQKPAVITENWDVTKTCLRLGSRIIGKCLMGSTCNSHSKGGAEFKEIFEDSNPTERNDNGQTVSGLYNLFIPMEWNYEGHIDRYGIPVFYDPAPSERVYDPKGSRILRGAIPVWQAEVDSFKHKPKKQNEYYRQYPRTEAHAFRDDANDAIFDLTKIYDQIDYNDSVLIGRSITKGNFHWLNGELDTKVYFRPDPRGRFYISWHPNDGPRNGSIKKNNIFYPVNEDIGAFGCDSYDISGVVGGGGSKGALHGLTNGNGYTKGAPNNEFFLEYISRPTAEIFFEDSLMALVYYGMPVLAENNKPRFLYHLKNRGYRKFSMNRPDKPYKDLSKTEKELGGIPSAGLDNINSHASAIESFIDRNVGYDAEGLHRIPDKIGSMKFNRTLLDWSKFDITNRTKFDASISSGLAIMGNNKHIYKSSRTNSKIILNFATTNNDASFIES